MRSVAHVSLLYLVACGGVTEPPKVGSGDPAPIAPGGSGATVTAEWTDTGTDTAHTGLVSVTLSVTLPGAECHTRQVLELPAEFWWAYGDEWPGDCSDMTWEAVTDEGHCWELTGLCGSYPEDPFLQRNEGEDPVPAATCASFPCP